MPLDKIVHFVESETPKGILGCRPRETTQDLLNVWRLACCRQSLIGSVRFTRHSPEIGGDCSHPRTRGGNGSGRRRPLKRGTAGLATAP